MDSARMVAVRSAAAGFSAGDPGAFAALFAEDAEIYGEPQIAERGLYVGPAGAREWVEEVRRRYTRAELHVRGHESLAEHCLLDVDFVVEGPGGGGAWRLAVVLRFVGEKVVEMHTYADRAAAVARFDTATGRHS